MTIWKGGADALVTRHASRISDHASRLSEGIFGFELGEKLRVFFSDGMIRAELAAGGIGGAAGEVFGFGKLSQSGKVTGEIVTGIEGFHVIGPAQFLGDAEHFAILGPGGGVVGLVKE